MRDDALCSPITEMVMSYDTTGSLVVPRCAACGEMDQARWIGRLLTGSHNPSIPTLYVPAVVVQDMQISAVKANAQSDDGCIPTFLGQDLTDTPC